MSAQQVFALCIDCNEIGYGITDSNGVFSRDSAASNHWKCETHVFGAPNDYPPAIRSVLTKIQASLPISDAEMWAAARQIKTRFLTPDRVRLDSLAAVDGLMLLLARPEPAKVDCGTCGRTHNAAFNHCKTCNRASRFINNSVCPGCKETSCSPPPSSYLLF